MTHRTRRSVSSTGQRNPWWPVLLAVLVVAVPTACVLWFMTEAVENRRVVLRRSLADADFTIAQERLNVYWREVASRLQTTVDAATSPSVCFHDCVLKDLADSVVCYDASGKPAYPTSVQIPAASETHSEIDWSHAEHLEYVTHDYPAAAEAYQQITSKLQASDDEDTDANLVAHAVLCYARCQVKAGNIAPAIGQLQDFLDRGTHGDVVETHGRLVVADIELRLAELIANPADNRFRSTVERLSRRLNDYSSPLMSAAQRTFLMRQLRNLIRSVQPTGDVQVAPPDSSTSSLSELVDFSTLDAEELAARFSEGKSAPALGDALYVSQVPNVWQLGSQNGRIVALFSTESVISRSLAAIDARALQSGARIRVIPPGGGDDVETGEYSAPAGALLPGWRLERFANASHQEACIDDAKTTAYFWTSILVIVSMSLFAVIIAGTFRRQSRLTRLKNDLVATVSHELKTPLSSIRLLVDTLLNKPELDEVQVREYLELIGKENRRLSRLIDNFLAFSRMERNKRVFDFASADPLSIVDSACEAMRERFLATEHELQVQVDEQLPTLDADTDALVMVLVNLLDNAIKYSPAQRPIVLTAYSSDGAVCFDVQDHGIGLSKTAARKVFRRFYQVDRHVSRETGGVGLGLTIVQFVVHAHGGTITVNSRLGEGSTFTVKFPAHSDDASGNGKTTG